MIGAYGKVREAIDCNTLKRVAIKIIKKRLLRRIKGGEDNLRNEINIMRKLKHTNVIQLIEVIQQEEKQKIYIVLEFAGAGSLQQVINSHPNKRLPLSDVWRFFRQFIEGLEYIVRIYICICICVCASSLYMIYMVYIYGFEREKRVNESEWVNESDACVHLMTMTMIYIYIFSCDVAVSHVCVSVCECASTDVPLLLLATTNHDGTLDITMMKKIKPTQCTHCYIHTCHRVLR